MSPAALLERPRVAVHGARAARQASAAPAPVETVGELIGRTFATLCTHKGAACPLCGGRMAARYGASGAAPVGGRCGDCGTTLA